MWAFATQLPEENPGSTKISYQNHGKKAADLNEWLLQTFLRDLADVTDILSYKLSRNRAP